MMPSELGSAGGIMQVWRDGAQWRGWQLAAEAAGPAAYGHLVSLPPSVLAGALGAMRTGGALRPKVTGVPPFAADTRPAHAFRLRPQWTPRSPRAVPTSMADVCAAGGPAPSIHSLCAALRTKLEVPVAWCVGNHSLHMLGGCALVCNETQCRGSIIPMKQARNLHASYSEIY